MSDLALLWIVMLLDKQHTEILGTPYIIATVILFCLLDTPKDWKMGFFSVTLL